jgi:hypothetical protein
MLEHPTGRDTTYRDYAVSRTLYHILLPLARNGGILMPNKETMTVQELIQTSRNNTSLIKQVIAAHLGIQEDDVDLTKLKGGTSNGRYQDSKN